MDIESLPLNSEQERALLADGLRRVGASERGGLTWGGYTDLVTAMGYELLNQEDESDYQGTSIYVVRDTVAGKFGLLDFGWGSCSGCDALQGCENFEDLLDLTYSLQQSIVWRDSVLELIHYLLDPDALLSKYWFTSEVVKSLIPNTVAYLYGEYVKTLKSPY